MLKLKRNQADKNVIVPKFGDRENEGTQGYGLNEQGNRPQCFDASRPTAEVLSSVLSCAAVPCRAILFALVRKNGGDLGRLHILRRLIATSRYARGFSFGVNRNHGIIAPAFFDGLMPCGKPSGLLSPKGQSANPHGVSLPHGRRGETSDSQTLGIKAMMRTLTRSVSTAFPSIPEPVFHPVDSRHNRAVDASKVNTFSDVADAVETLMERCADAYADAGRLPSVRRTCARNVLRSYVSELVDFCKEVEAIPARSFTIREA